MLTATKQTAGPVRPRAEVEARLTEFLPKLQEHTQKINDDRGFYPFQCATLTLDFGQKNVKIVANDRHITTGELTGSRSVYGFVNLDTGDILKAAGWKAPAKHARGNIFAADFGLSCCDAYGPGYLR